MHERSSLKSQALQGLIGASVSIPLDVVARWSHGEAKVGELHVNPSEYRTLVAAAGRHDEGGYPIESRSLMDDILSRVGILCRTGLPACHQLYLRPRPTRLRLQDHNGRHVAVANAWLGYHHGGLCLHVGGSGPHVPVDGPCAASFLRSIHDTATGRRARVELWGNTTLDCGQAQVLCRFLDGIGLRVPASTR